MSKSKVHWIIIILGLLSIAVIGIVYFYITNSFNKDINYNQNNPDISNQQNSNIIDKSEVSDALQKKFTLNEYNQGSKISDIDYAFTGLSDPESMMTLFKNLDSLKADLSEIKLSYEDFINDDIDIYEYKGGVVNESFKNKFYFDESHATETLVAMCNIKEGTVSDLSIKFPAIFKQSNTIAGYIRIIFNPVIKNKKIINIGNILDGTLSEDGTTSYVTCDSNISNFDINNIVAIKTDYPMSIADYKTLERNINDSRYRLYQIEYINNPNDPLWLGRDVDLSNSTLSINDWAIDYYFSSPYIFPIIRLSGTIDYNSDLINITFWTWAIE